jgi:hypothetical protein
LLEAGKRLCGFPRSGALLAGAGRADGVAGPCNGFADRVENPAHRVFAPGAKAPAVCFLPGFLLPSARSQLRIKAQREDILYMKVLCSSSTELAACDLRKMMIFTG